MKEGKKKFLLGLGVGALTCVGMFCLTGCNFVQVSQQEYDRLMESVEFVENTVDIYEATEFYNRAIAKNMDTSGDFWNNMKVQTTITYGDEIVENYETFFFKTELEEQIYLNKKIGQTDYFNNNSYKTIYTELGALKTISKEDETLESSDISGYFVDCFLSGALAHDFYFGTMVDGELEFFRPGDILKAEINEEFNYVITFMLKEVESERGSVQVRTMVVDNEIDENANLVSQTITITTSKDGVSTTEKIVNKYSYGTVEFSEFQIEFETLVYLAEQAQE